MSGASRLVVGLEGPGAHSPDERSFLAVAGRSASSSSRATSCRPRRPRRSSKRSGPPATRRRFSSSTRKGDASTGSVRSSASPSRRRRRSRDKGVDRIHECAYLMGRAARLLGFDVDFAPVLDLAQPGAGDVVLAGRTFGFHAEDVVLAGTVFLHGLARAGVASCLKHFPGLGRGPVDSHVALPVVDAHDVDLMVTDVAPFTKLARAADGVMVGHAAYPGFTGDETPASLSPRIHAILRERIGWDGVVYSDDLGMGALGTRSLARARFGGGARRLRRPRRLGQPRRRPGGGRPPRGRRARGDARGPRADRRAQAARRRASPGRHSARRRGTRSGPRSESWLEELAKPRVSRSLDGPFPALERNAVVRVVRARGFGRSGAGRGGARRGRRRAGRRASASRAP